MTNPALIILMNSVNAGLRIPAGTCYLARAIRQFTDEKPYLKYFRPNTLSNSGSTPSKVISSWWYYL
jgi:hypothetical protein